MSSDWKNAYVYSEGFKNQIKAYINSLKSSGQTILPSDFSAVEHLHPAGQRGLAKFMESCSLSMESECLDIGCGIGGTSRFLSTLGYKVLGIDLLEHFIELASEISELVGLSHKSTFQSCNLIENNPFSNRFGFALLIGVLMYERGSEFFKAVYNTLQTGGILYIEDYFLLKENQLTIEESYLLNSYVAVPFRTKSVFKKDLEDAGFEVQELEDFSVEWSEYVWQRAENILKSSEEGNEEVQLVRYGSTSPQMLSHMYGYSQEDLLEKFPRTCANVGIQCVYQKDKILGTTRIAAFKR